MKKSLLLLISLFSLSLGACGINTDSASSSTRPDSNDTYDTSSQSDGSQETSTSVAPIVNDERFIYGKYNNSYENSILGVKDEYKNLSEISLPSSYNGNKIISISYGAFRGSDRLVRINIPQSIEIIGERAFDSCINLESVNFEKDSILKTIGSNAFYFCASLKTINVPNTVLNIGEGAFSDCQSLASFNLSDNISSISSNAFSGCYSLTSFVIPNSVLTIGNNAFKDCYNLVEIINKSSLIITKASNDNGSIGYYALNIVSDEEESNISNDNGFIILRINDDAYLVRYIGNETNITVPDYVTIIKDYAFYGYVVSLNGEYIAHSPLYRINSIVVPEGVKTIGNHVFDYCTGLTSITLPSSLESVGDSIFRDCNKIKEIVNKSNIFVYASGARKISDASASKLMTTDDGFIIYDNTGTKELVSYIGDEVNLTIPSNVTVISENAFRFCLPIENISMSDSVSLIGTAAFQGCLNLKTINISKSVTMIYSSTFSDCLSLEEIEIPNKVTQIGANAFLNCKALRRVSISNGSNLFSLEGCAFQRCNSLTEITLPASLSSMHDWAFIDCGSLENIFVQDGNSNFSSVFGVLYDYNKTTLVKHPSKKQFDGSKLPNTVTKFGPSSFNQYQFSELVIPNSITEIGDNAFFGASSIKKVTIPVSVKKIGFWSFVGMQHYANEVGYYYLGTIDEWNEIEQDSSFSTTTYNYTTIHCTDGDILL